MNIRIAILLFFCMLAPILLPYGQPVVQASSGDVGIGSYEPPKPPMATQDPDIMSKILQNYKMKAEAWLPILQKYAFITFGWFLVIDIILFGAAAGFSVANGGKSVGLIISEFFMMVLLPAAFMYATISYYQEWGFGIVSWLTEIAGKATTSEISASNAGAGSFFQLGLELFNLLTENIKLFNPSSWMLILAAFIILVCFALMAMQILLIKCESYIVMCGGIIILGLGAFSQTRQYAVNFMRYVLSVAIKLYVLQLIIGIAFSFVKDFKKTTTNLDDVTVIIGGSIVLLGLVRTIPDICAGIIQGQHVGTGNALSGAVASVGAGAMAGMAVMSGIARGGLGAANVPGALSALSKAADASGASGLGKAGFMAKGILGAGVNAMAGGDNKVANSGLGTFSSKLTEKAMSSMPTDKQK